MAHPASSLIRIILNGMKRHHLMWAWLFMFEAEYETYPSRSRNRGANEISIKILSQVGEIMGGKADILRTTAAMTPEANGAVGGGVPRRVGIMTGQWQSLLAQLMLGKAIPSRVGLSPFVYWRFTHTQTHVGTQATQNEDRSNSQPARAEANEGWGSVGNSWANSGWTKPRNESSWASSNTWGDTSSESIIPPEQKRRSMNMNRY
jgi:hypothetical protein